MTDIYDIKTTFIGLPIDIMTTSIFIVFIIILNLLFKFLYTKKKANKTEQIIENKIERVKINYLEKLNNLEENIMSRTKDIFYSEISLIIRGILEEKNYDNISKMTFEEINSLGLDLEIKNLIKKIYIKEYKDNIEDTKEIRINIINKIKELV